MHFLGYYIFRPLGGAAPWNFYTHYRLTKPCYRTQELGGRPPKNFNRENLKFGLKFSVLGSITSGLWEYPHDTFSVDVPWRSSDKLGTIFGRPVPENLGGQKIVQNSARFLTTFDFDREYLRNGSTYRNRKSSLSTSTLPTGLPCTLGEKKLVYVGPQTKKLLSLMYIHHNVLFFGRLHFGP